MTTSSLLNMEKIIGEHNSDMEIGGASEIVEIRIREQEMEDKADDGYLVTNIYRLLEKEMDALCNGKEKGEQA